MAFAGDSRSAWLFAVLNGGDGMLDHICAKFVRE